MPETKGCCFSDAKWKGLTVKRRCELLGVARSSVYYTPKERSSDDLEREEKVKRRIDYWHTKSPCSGVRKLRRLMREHDGIFVGRKLIKLYMYEMGIYAIYPKPRLSIPGKEHKAPYLLRNMSIFLPNQVWAIDITYIPMRYGHMYLTAVIDWHSRYIVGWELSDTLDTAPVVKAVEDAIGRHGTPAIINSDQGCQFTSDDYRALLRKRGIRQSMDGKARWIDNVIIERWFRSLKTEWVYINEYVSPRELRAGIREYVKDYNDLRPHQTHGYDTPATVFHCAFLTTQGALDTEAVA
jgi:putative transposase